MLSKLSLGQGRLLFPCFLWVCRRSSSMYFRYQEVLFWILVSPRSFLLGMFGRKQSNSCFCSLMEWIFLTFVCVMVRCEEKWMLSAMLCVKIFLNNYVVSAMVVCVFRFNKGNALLRRMVLLFALFNKLFFGFFAIGGRVFCGALWNKNCFWL